MIAHIGEESIALLAGDDLDPKQRADIERHLSACSECRGALEEYRRARESLAALRDKDISASDYAWVRRSVLEQVTGTKAHVPFLRWIALAVTLLVLGVALRALWNRTHSPISIAQRPVKESPGPVAGQEAARRPAPAQTPVTSRSVTRQPARRLHELAQRRRFDTPERALEASAAVQTVASKAPVLDDIAVKLETEDPNVIIIWLSSHKGERR